MVRSTLSDREATMGAPFDTLVSVKTTRSRSRYRSSSQAPASASWLISASRPEVRDRPAARVAPGPRSSCRAVPTFRSTLVSTRRPASLDKGPQRKYQLYCVLISRTMI